MPALLRFLLDVVTRARVVAEVDDACKAIEAIAHGNIQCLSEDAVPLLRICDDLCVTSRDV